MCIRDSYEQGPKQTEDEAILSSYPTLLVSRSKAYTELADVTISSEIILNPEMTVEQIFEALKPAV